MIASSPHASDFGELASYNWSAAPLILELREIANDAKHVMKEAESGVS